MPRRTVGIWTERVRRSNAIGALQPDQPNPFDSLGEVHYFLGHFEEAENIFSSAMRNPAFLEGRELVKAAQCRLMRGDRPGADELFTKFLSTEGAANPRRPVLEAQWLYVTGRRQRAMDNMSALAARGGPTGPYAAAQIVVWSRLEGDVARARAAVAACGPLSAVCNAIVDPQSEVPPQLSQAMSFYRPVLARDFQGAVPVLKKAYEQADASSDEGIRTLYAWALIETGRAQDAAPLIQNYPLTLKNGDWIFSAFEFPRSLAVRSAVLKQQGQSQQAAAALALFEQYSARQ